MGYSVLYLFLHILLVKRDLNDLIQYIIPNIIDSGMLPKIRQMGIEVHLLPVTENIGYYRKLVKTLQLLEANGMVRFSSLANPASYAYINAFDFTDHTCHEIA